MLARAELGFGLEGLGKIGCARIGKRRIPVAADHDAVGELAQRLGELHGFGALLDIENLGRIAGGRHLLADRDRLRGDGVAKDDLGPFAFGFGDDRGELGVVDRKFGVLNDVVAELLGQRRPDGAANSLPIGPVVVPDRDLLVGLHAEIRQGPELRGGQLGYREEQIPGVVPLADRREDLQRIAARHQRLLRAFGHQRAGVHQRRRAGAQHGDDMIAGDQRLGIGSRRVRIGPVVADDEFHHPLAAADRNATSLVHLVDSAFVTPLLKAPETRQRARQRQRGADHDVVGAGGTRAESDGNGGGQRAGLKNAF